MQSDSPMKKQKRLFPKASFFLKTACLVLSILLLGGCGANKTEPKETEINNKQTKGAVIKMKDFGEIKIGDTISFGSFETDGKTDTGTENLTWLVLAVEEGKALVITTEGIDCQLYNTEAIETDWERCSLRKWLNGKFLTEAFTAEEAAQIAITELPGEENSSGKASRDKLFLLSISEAEIYFSSDEKRLCKPTPLAIQHQVYADDSTGFCAWWLRNQGSSAERAALVDEFGSVNYGGDGVYCEGTAVRPAMWITLS